MAAYIHQFFMMMDLLVIVRVALILSCLIVVIQMVKVNHGLVYGSCFELQSQIWRS